MPVDPRRERLCRFRWHVVSALAIVLFAVPVLNPIGQRLGTSVTYRVGLNKRSVVPPRKHSGPTTLIVSPAPVGHVSARPIVRGTFEQADAAPTFLRFRSSEPFRAPPSTRPPAV